MGAAVEKHHRRSIRLAGYDYAQAGAYFVTICAQDRECLFGDVVDGEVRLNEYGAIVREEWLRTAEIRSNVELDAFVVMPNHFHGIIILHDCRGTLQRAPTDERAPTVEQFGKPTSGTIPTIVRLFKSAVTKRINEHRGTPGAPVWQRNYYEHIVRNEESLHRIREYITTNPLHWDEDKETPLWQRARTRITETTTAAAIPRWNRGAVGTIGPRRTDRNGKSVETGPSGAFLFFGRRDCRGSGGAENEADGLKPRRR